MTILDNGTRDQYTATASQTVFPYTFEIFQKEDIAVEQNGTLLTVDVDFTVSGVGNDSGGNVTLTTGATVNDIITIYRSMPLERTTDYQNAGDFLANDVNSDFDRLWAALQQVNNTTNSSPQLLVTTNTLITGTALSTDNNVIATTGYLANGDGGGGVWRKTGVTGLTASQTPSDLADAKLTDSSGVEWELLPIYGHGRKVYNAKSLGVVGDGVADDTNAIKAGLVSGGVIGNGLTCKVTSRISVTTNERGIYGDITLEGDAASFARTDGSYDNADGTILHVEGDDFELKDGARIKLSSNSNGANTTTALVLRQATRFLVEQCEFDTFSKSKVIRVESCNDGRFLRNYIHDCLMDDTTTGQLTGIDVDDNRIGGAGSENIEIAFNRIENLTVSPSFEASFGYQTDGINISNKTSQEHHIHHNHIENVGEGIDCFGVNCEIHNNTLEDLSASGIKIIHGASYNHIHHNTVLRPRTYGIGVFGSTNASSDAVGNLFESNTVEGTNSTSLSATTSSAIQVEDNTGVSLPKNNIFRGNICIDSVNADRIIYNNSADSTNSFIDTKVIGTVPTTKTTNTPNSVMTFFDKARVRAYLQAQSVNNITETTLEYANESEDATSEFNNSTYTFTASYPRVVDVTAALRTASAVTPSTWRMKIKKNGSDYKTMEKYAGVAGDFVMDVGVVGVDLAEGDTLAITAYHDSGSARTLTANEVLSSLYIMER